MIQLDFIGIGVQRAATSWGFGVLAEHPQIFMAKKEIQFFNHHYDQGEGWYQRHFDGRKAGQLVGEFTPDYLPSRVAIERLVHDQPRSKFIVILRDPVDRAVSAYQLYRGRGEIGAMSLQDAIERHRFLVEYGFYAQQLEYLYSMVPAERVYVCLYDDVVASPIKLAQDLYSWLGVDSTFCSQQVDRKANSSFPPLVQKAYDRISLLRSFRQTRLGQRAVDLMHRWNQRVQKKASVVDQDVLSQLSALYCEDTLELEKLLNRSLCDWKPIAIPNQER